MAASTVRKMGKVPIITHRQGWFFWLEGVRSGSLFFSLRSLICRFYRSSIRQFHYFCRFSRLPMKKSLIALSLGTLGLGIAEFVMMGILPDVARSLSIDIARAGHFISAYAAGVCLGAPILLFARKMPPKRILKGLVGLMFLGNLCDECIGWDVKYCSHRLFLTVSPCLSARFGCTRLSLQHMTLTVCMNWFPDNK